MKHWTSDRRMEWHPIWESLMAIRNWSFTKLWAVSAIVWAFAALAGAAADYFDRLGVVVLLLAFIPTFLAGGWAGEHPEIATWPRTRLIAMWTLALCAVVGMTDYLDHLRLAAAVIAAPVAILTIRWYELTGGTGPRVPVLPPPASPTLSSSAADSEPSS